MFGSACACRTDALGGVAGAAGERARTVRALGHRQQPMHTSMQWWDGTHHCIDAVI